MKTTYAIATAVALLFVAAAAGGSVTAETTNPVTELQISTGELSLDHAGLYEEYDCDVDPQLALLVVDLPGCGDFGGDHTVGGFGYIIVGFRSINAGNAGALPLTGTLQALLESDNGGVDFRCSWDAGVWTGCQIVSAVWPPVGSTFTYSCKSLEGSLGHWGECYLGHE